MAGRWSADLLGAAVGTRCGQLDPANFPNEPFNDKLDLAFEAVADLIASDTAAVACAALRSLQGEFPSRQVRSLVEGLTELRIMSRRRSTFRGEIDFADGSSPDACGICGSTCELCRRWPGSLLPRDGMTVDRWPAECRQIQPAEPSGRARGGHRRRCARTTRDVLREQISIDGMLLYDRYGWFARQRRPWSNERVSAAHEIAAADRILMVVDDRLGLTVKSASLNAVAGGHQVTVICQQDRSDRRTPMVRDGEWGGEIYCRPRPRWAWICCANTRTCGITVAGGNLRSSPPPSGGIGAAGGGIGGRRINWRFIAPANRRRDCVRPARTSEISGSLRPDLLSRIFSSFLYWKSETLVCSEAFRKIHIRPPGALLCTMLRMFRSNPLICVPMFVPKMKSGARKAVV